VVIDQRTAYSVQVVIDDVPVPSCLNRLLVVEVPRRDLVSGKLIARVLEEDLTGRDAMKPGRSSHTEHDSLDIEAGHDIEQLASATWRLLGRVHAALTRQKKPTKLSTCRRDDSSGNQEHTEQHRVSALRFIAECPHHSLVSIDE